MCDNHVGKKETVIMRTEALQLLCIIVNYDDYSEAVQWSKTLKRESREWHTLMAL